MSAASQALRTMLTGPVLRSIIGWRDNGENRIVRVEREDGTDPVMTQEGEDTERDAWIHVVDILSDRPSIAMQHIPGNILFSKPRVGDTALLVRPGDADGPGVPYLILGDGGDPARWPSWYHTKSGIFSPDPLRLESTGGDIELQPKSDGVIKLGKDATKGVARVDDSTANGSLVITAVGPLLTVTYTPPGGTPQVTTISFVSASPVAITVATGGTTSLAGKIDSASSKVKAE